MYQQPGIDGDQDGSGVGVNEVVVVPDEEISEDTSLVEVAEADHVLDSGH